MNKSDGCEANSDDRVLPVEHCIAVVSTGIGQVQTKRKLFTMNDRTEKTEKYSEQAIPVDIGHCISSGIPGNLNASNKRSLGTAKPVSFWFP